MSVLDKSSLACMCYIKLSGKFAHIEHGHGQHRLFMDSQLEYEFFVCRVL